MVEKSEVISYTESELNSRHIGRSVVSKSDYGWDIKVRAYRDVGVYLAYRKFRDSLKILFLDWKNYVDEGLVNRVSVLVMDTFLIRRSRGEKVSVPQPVHKSSLVEVKNTVDGLLTMADFGDAVFGDPSPGEVIQWIHTNVLIRDIDPKTAPSPGAYAQLKWVQESKENKADFYKTTFTKTIPAKSLIENLSKKNDDNREHFSLLDELSGEVQDDTE